MSYQIRIDQLTRENYDTWKIHVKAILIKNDYWEYVSGLKCKPQKEEEKLAWIKVDEKAKAELLLAISPSLLTDVNDCVTSHDVWKKLKDIYDSKGPARKATLLKKLILEKATGNDNIIDHVSRFFDTVDKLKSIEIQIDDDLLSILLLYSLPDQFENFRVAIESRDELPKPAILKTKIIEEYNARYAQPGPSDLMMVKHEKYDKPAKHKNQNKTDYRKGKKDNRLKLMCYNCKRFGHKASDCRYKLEPKERSSIVREETLHCNININKCRSKWILDSGATSHMVNNADHFVSMMKSEDTDLHLADNGKIKVRGKGTIKMKTRYGNKIRLTNALYVPDLRVNLLSVSKITDHNHSVKFFNNKAIITNTKNEIILKAVKRNGLYELTEDIVHKCHVASHRESLRVWHNRYGHINFKSLVDIIKQHKVRGINIDRIQNDHNLTCETCIQAKQTRLPFPKKVEMQSSQVLELIHSDICGPIRVKSGGGAEYFITFIDDFSRWTEVYFLKHKNEALKYFKIFKAKMENLTENKIKRLRTDNGTEYNNKDFSKFLEESGIHHEVSVAYTPQQNGIAERKNRTLLEMARSMLIHSKLPLHLWAEAIATANHIRNRSPSNSINGEIPYKLWRNREPHVGYFRTFGTLAYVLDKRPNKRKFDPRSRPFYLVGYCENAKAYRLWSKEDGKLIKTRDVKFVNEIKDEENKIDLYEELLPWNEEKDKNKTIEQTTDTKSNLHKESEKEETEERKERKILNEVKDTKRKRGRPMLLRTGQKGRPRKLYHTEKGENDKDDEKNTQEVEEEKSEESNTSSDYYDLSDENNNGLQEAFLAAEHDPENIEEMENSAHKEEWKRAIEIELEAHEKNNTWEIIDKPDNVKVIGCRWVFTTKYDNENNLIARKARLVAKGCAQKYGIDFHETYAPVARQKSIRTIIAIAAKLNLHLHQFDVRTAYLNGDLKENIYMQIPDFYDDSVDKRKTNRVCKLRKAIYGLKQSGRVWYEKLDLQLQKIGCAKLENEPCMYKYEKGGKFLLIGIYVDDIITASNDKDMVEWFKGEISKVFEIKDMGNLKYFLGIEINKEKGGEIILTQKRYIQKILMKFKMENCNTVNTPMDKNVQISKEMSPKTKEEKDKMSNIPYQNLIGSLLYLAVTTRPDIAYATNIFSQYNSNYGQAHWIGAKRILRYLKKTINYGLVFRKSDDDLLGYVDADWASNIDDRKSHTGYFFKLSNGPISWECKKQKTTALSSAEAEYMAITEATKEAIYLRNLLSEIGFRGDDPVIIYNDNQSAQFMANNNIINSRSKHIDIRYHFVRDALTEKKIKLRYMNTNEMPADVLTKPLSKSKFEICLENMSMKEYKQT